MSETVAELREKLNAAQIEAAYYRGRAESLETLMAQRNQPSAANLPPELLSALLAAKMKDQKGAQEGA